MSENQGEFLSLADLASVDVSRVEALTSRLPAEGIYDVLGKSVEVDFKSSPDSTDRLTIKMKAEVLAAELLDVDQDPERMVGRDLTSYHSIWAGDEAEGVGLLKGRVAKVGLPTDGPIGGTGEGQPGFIDGIVGHQFQIRVRHGKLKNGEATAYLDWLPAPERD